MIGLLKKSISRSIIMGGLAAQDNTGSPDLTIIKAQLTVQSDSQRLRVTDLPT